MAKSPLYTPVLLRDGTSQSMRRPAALDPSFAQVDERSTADLLDFVRAYGKELVYYDEADRPRGDFGALFDPRVAIEDLVHLVEGRVERVREHVLHACRPHAALLLAFVKLLCHAQDHLNTLTRRHLDFYYRTVLGMTARPPAAYRVSVMVKLADGVEQALLPAGSLLDAGKDSRDKPLVYRTDRDVVLSRAQIAALCTVRIARHTTTIQSAALGQGQDGDAALLAALAVALGDPKPADALPPYKSAEVGVALLRELATLVKLAGAALYMELFELRSLLALRTRRQARAGWSDVNGYLQIAARTRRSNPSYVLVTADPTDFTANLESAVGHAPAYTSLPGIASPDDLYEQRLRPDVAEFIRTTLYFTNMADFIRMMQIKLRIDAEWHEINRMLELAGRRKRGDTTYRLAPSDPTAFADNLAAAIGAVDYASAGVSNIDEYGAELAHIESAFYMSAEDFAYMVDAFGPSAQGKDRSRAYEILAEAYARKVEARRRSGLELLRLQASNPLEGLRSVLGRALGREGTQESASELVERTRDFLTDDTELAFLNTMVQAAITPDGIPDTSWQHILHIAEGVQRVREGAARAVAQKVQWLDIHAYKDATQVTSSLGIEADRGTPRWKAFGAAVAQTDPTTPPPPVLGWAIGSPALSLGEGERVIAVTLGFKPQGFDAARMAAALAAHPFAVEISTEKGFVPATAVTVLQGDYQTLSGVSRAMPEPLAALKLSIALGRDADPVAAPAAGSPARPAARWPMLRLLLSPVWDANRGHFITLYEPLRGLLLEAVHVKVEARGVTALALENDRSRLEAPKPFEPFGNRPSVGSRLYVGHPELVQKRLDSLRFHVEWMNVPQDLGAHYAGYGITPDFKTRIALHDGRRELDVAQAPLFAGPDPRAVHTIEILDVPAALEAKSPRYDYRQAGDAQAGGGAVSRWSRYFVWELMPLDFQHHNYPRLAAARATQMAVDIATKPSSLTAADYQINPPYTPAIKRLAVDYTSSIELLPGTGLEAKDDRIYHVHPFGECEAVASPGEGVPFLPRYDDYEGELYIGIRDVAPAGGSLSILFQLAEGSADPDAAPSAVAWSYLSGDRWISLHDGNILSDGTLGLRRTGILELSLDAALPSRRMSPELYWLRAAIRHGATGIPDVVGIHAQAVAATFADRDNAPDHDATGLRAGRIRHLVKPLREVAAIEQPYPAYGGTGAERDADLYARVSERLRHKQRGLSIWDYERLVLERFPQIYKAKCLPAEQHPRPGEPGKVAVIVIPDIRTQIPFDPFEPKAKAATLAEIEAYLSDKIPPPAKVEARNAYFVAVKVRILVRFMRGADEGFCKKKLNEEICRFLSPWAYDEGAEITIGNRIYASSIVDFVDRRPYVDFVAGITLFMREGGLETEIPRPSSGGYFVSTDRPDAVLVAAREHEIDTSWQYRAEQLEEAVWEKTYATKEQATGISHRVVGLNFIIGEETRPPYGLGSMGIEVDFQIL